MKYVLLMQFPLADWRTSRIELWPPQDVKRHLAFLKRFRDDLTASGELVSTEGLVGPEEARIVVARKDGSPAVTDGPFPESKEFLAGYCVIDVDSRERAFEIAARLSSGPGPGAAPLNIPIEVRAVHFMQGDV